MIKRKHWIDVHLYKKKIRRNKNSWKRESKLLQPPCHKLPRVAESTKYWLQMPSFLWRWASPYLQSKAFWYIYSSPLALIRTRREKLCRFKGNNLDVGTKTNQEKKLSLGAKYLLSCDICFLWFTRSCNGDRFHFSGDSFFFFFTIRYLVHVV